MRERVNTAFYNRPEWKALRYEVLREQGAKCIACNSTREGGAVLHVDHVKPRSVYPELALEKSNLQILCADCNLGKSNKFADDFRSTPKISDPGSSAFIDKQHKTATAGFDFYPNRMTSRAEFGLWKMQVLWRYAFWLLKRDVRFRSNAAANLARDLGEELTRDRPEWESPQPLTPECIAEFRMVTREYLAEQTAVIKKQVEAKA